MTRERPGSAWAQARLTCHASPSMARHSGQRVPTMVDGVCQPVPGSSQSVEPNAEAHQSVGQEDATASEAAALSFESAATPGVEGAEGSLATLLQVSRAERGPSVR